MSLDILIEDLPISVRTKNCLHRNNCFTLLQLLKLSEEDLLNIRNMGQKSVQEALEIQRRYASNPEEFDSYVHLAVDYNMDSGKLTMIKKANASYSENDTILYRNINNNGLVLDDIQIQDIGFSVRTTGALINGGYFFISQVATEEYSTIMGLKNMGTKSVDEIIEFLKAHAEISGANPGINDAVHELSERIIEQLNPDNNISYIKSQDVLSSCYDYVQKNGPINESVISDNKIIEILDSKYIIDALSTYYYKIICNSDIAVPNAELKKLTIPVFVEYKLDEHAISSMIQNGVIEKYEGGLRRKLPSIETWISTLKDNQKKVILLRLEGKTLEECGQEFGCTRERIRQIIVKAIKIKPLLREDDYLYWYEKYEFSYKDMSLIFPGITERIFIYLGMIAKRGELSPEEILSDERINSDLYRRTKEYINRNSLLVDGKYISLKKEAIFLYLAETYAKNQDMGGDEFFELYNNFLKEHSLDNDKLQANSSRNLFSILERNRKILTKYGRRLRYYSIDEHDISDLIARIHLEQFNNVEISTLKLVEQYKDVMEEFGIQDEYELHNLLKKTESEWNPNNRYNLSITRMPFIAFGEVDRTRQAEELLFEIAPVSMEEYCEFYEMEYGVAAQTVMANFTPLISNYYHNGMFTIDQPLYSAYEIEYMKATLTDDFYFIEDIKDIHINKYGEEDVKKVNPRSLKEMGFKVYAGYALKSDFPSVAEYFNTYLTRNDTIDLKSVDKRITYMQMLNVALDNLRASFDLLEYEDMKFIKYSRFNSVYPDITKDILLEYAEKAISYVDELFFTVKSLKDKGFSHRVDDVQLGEWFKAGVIKNSKRIRFLKTGGGVIFYKGDTAISTLDFVRFILSKIIKMDIYEFVRYINDTYGINIPKEKIITIVKPTEMYYDSVMEKIYLDKQYYYEEI